MSSGRVRIDDELSLHHETSGRGETTVLLVPGWTMTTAVFERQREYFAGSANYRFVTYDPRAHGESTKTVGGHYYAPHGRDLGALIGAGGGVQPGAGWTSWKGVPSDVAHLRFRYAAP